MTDLAWGFDPGLTTGWSLVDYSNGEEIDGGSFPFEEAPTFFEDRERLLQRTKIVVVEDFALRGGKAQAQIGSKFETVQVIGMLRLWSWRARVPLKLQPASIKPIAQRFTRRVPKGAHSKSHAVDAYNHVEYYLHGIGHYETVFQKELRES